MVYFCIFMLCFFHSIWSVVGSGGNIFGQTHFTSLEEFCAGSPVRITLIQALPPEEVLKKNHCYIACVGWYGKSENDRKLSGFFLPQEDVELTTTGGPDYFLPGALPYLGAMPTNKAIRDLDASIFGITDSEFFSETSILPKAITKYIGILGYYAFTFNENNVPRLSLQFAMPIVSNQRFFIGQENIYKTGQDYAGSTIRSLLGGLSRPELFYQRWNFCDQGMSKTEISHFECNISFNGILKDIISIETYIGALFPGNKKNAYDTKTNLENRFVFYPENMASQYYGLQWGNTINVFLYQNDFRTIKFVFGNNLLYFLPAHQVRSFDLFGRSWSRYLPTYNNFNTEYLRESALSNSLTYVCRVSPNFSSIITSELHYIKNKASLGIGYCMYGRQSESVTILEDIDDMFLKGTDQNIISPVSLVRTAALQLTNEDVQILEENINTGKLEANNNYYYAKINNNMIDIQSATHPAILAGELYLKGNLQLSNNCSILGGIASRFCHNNVIIQYESMWFGFELVF